MLDKKILDVTCGSRTIWFNKHNPAAIYCDIRKEELTGIWKPRRNGLATGRSFVAQCRILRYYEGRF